MAVGMPQSMVNNLRHRVEMMFETWVRPKPMPAASSAGLHIQLEVANDERILVMADEDFSE